MSIVDDENKGVVVVSGVGGCPDEAGGPNNNYQAQVLDRLIACGSQRYAGRRVALQQRCRVFINGDWLAGRVVAHRGAEGEAYHVLLDNDRKVAVRRDAPELIEPEEESDDDEDDRTRLYEDACRARDNAANYEGRFEPERSVSWRRKPASARRAQGATARAARAFVSCAAPQNASPAARAVRVHTAARFVKSATTGRTTSFVKRRGLLEHLSRMVGMRRCRVK